MRKILYVLSSILLFPTAIQAQGLDEKINEALMPYAVAWKALIDTPINIVGTPVPIVVILLVLGAGFFTVYFGFPSIRLFGLAIGVVRGKYDDIEKSESGDHGEVSHFQALATAVSGTVGLGNISGVAIAIAMGGAGATFWMIVCGLLGMSSKLVECTLGVAYREIDAKGKVFGGPMYYLEKGFKERKWGRLGKFLAVLFAILAVGASFGGGNVFQSNQAAEQMINLLQIEGGSSGFFLGLIQAVLVGLVIIGGIKRIAAITSRLVPMMAVIYIVAALIIIFANFSLIDDAFLLIFRSAFSLEAGLSGLLGVLIVGFQRAAFSNEAGTGSSAIAHSAVKTQFPASEGVVALLEPFIDTVVICTMTALVIIFFNIESPENLQGIFQYGAVGATDSSVLIQATQESIGGVELTSRAFDSVLPGFSIVLTIAIVLFAFSTMISWSFYGIQAWTYLFGRGFWADLSYKVLFLIFVVLGASVSLEAVLKFSDGMILALVFPNMIGLLILYPKVKQQLDVYLQAIKRHKGT
ncbi:MAG: alanine/glycine:cation symporter family protein [Bacteroidota bacterium]